MLFLKLSLRPWCLAPWSQIFSSLVFGFLVFLVGFLFCMDRALGPIVHKLKSEQVVTAYLEPGLDTATEGRLVDSIRLTLGSQTAQSAQIKQVDRPEFINELKGHYPELANELEKLGRDVEAVIPRFVSISGILEEGVVEKLRALTGIESAETSMDRHEHVVGAFLALRWVARLFAAGLVLALVTGLVQLCRLNSHLHSSTARLLRMWGAGSNLSHIPTLLSGMWVGVVGGLLAFCAWILASEWLVLQVRTLSPFLKDLSTPSFKYGVVLFVAAVGIGLVSGLFSRNNVNDYA